MEAIRTHVRRTARAAAVVGMGLIAALSACSQAPHTDSEPVGTSTQALFTNTGFEGDMVGSAPSSWNVALKIYTGYGTGTIDTPPANLAALNLLDSPAVVTGTGAGTFTALDNTKVVGGVTVSQRDQDLINKYPTASNDKFRFPKYGTRSAVVNYDPSNRGSAQGIGRNHNANIMSDTSTIAVTDIDPTDGLAHIRFVYAPIVQSGNHALNQQPFVALRLTKVSTSAILYEDFIAASTAGAPWLASGGSATDPYYFAPMDPSDHVAGWKVVDIVPGSGQVTLGDEVKLEIIAAGCYATAHWGRVYVDSFGLTIPDLNVVAVAPETANEDTDITYTYTYRNGGAATAINAFIDFAIPTGTTFKSVSLAGCTQTSFPDPRQGKLTGTFPNIELHNCPIGSVAPNGTGSFTMVAHANPATAGNVVKNGHYSSYADNADPLVGPDYRTLITSAGVFADLGTTLASGVAAIAPNGSLSYRADVTNGGANTATKVTITTAVNGGTLGMWSCIATGGATCPAATGTGAISASNVSIPAGGKLSYTLAATAGASGTIVTRIDTVVNLPETDPFSRNNSAAEILGIGTVRDVVVTKGSNLGVIQSAPAAILCGMGCATQTGKFLDGSTVVLQATPPAGGSFLGWTGDCSGTAPTCTIVANANKTVGARFLGPPVSLTATGGAIQTTSVSTPFAQPLAIKLADADGTGVPGRTITFAPPVTGASAAITGGNTLVTDANGVGSAIATANANEGDYSVPATTGALMATFSLHNRFPPGNITIISGSPQQKVVGGVFDQPLVVEVRDYQNQVKPNAVVRFSGPLNGASASFSTAVVTTGADGRATANATANYVAGTYNVNVTVDNTAMPGPIALTNLPGPAATIRALDGTDRQTTRVSTPFAQPLAVGVFDAYGNPVPGVSVQFVSPGTEPNATIAPASVTTDASGKASASATASGTPGGYIASAIVEGTSLKADFALGNITVSPIVVTVLSGSPQQTVVGSEFGAPLIVTASRDNQPVPNLAISFSAPGQDPTAVLSATTVNTDGAGNAQITARAAKKIGSFQVIATTTDAAQAATFALKNLAGAPARIIADPGASPQNARINTPFVQPLRVRVVDESGNPVAGVSVTYAPPDAAPTAALGVTTAVTDENGYAAVDAAAGPTVGTYVVRATAAGVSDPAQFQLGNLIGSPVFVALKSGSPQSTLVNTAFADPLVVTVRDIGGTVVAANSVSFTAPSTGTSAVLSSASAATSGTGDASVTATANAVAGTYDVYAIATTGAAPLAFALTNTEGTVAQLKVGEASSPQSAYLSTAYPLPLRVTALDASGNPVKGAIITFTPPASGPSATLSNVSPATDPNGLVEIYGVGFTAAGTFDLQAASPGATATISLTNLDRAAPVDTGSLEGGGISCSTHGGRARFGDLLGLLGVAWLVRSRRRSRVARQQQANCRRFS